MSITIEDSGIVVNISRETRSVDQRGFGSLLFLHPLGAVTERIKSYTSLQSVADDYNSSEEPYKAALSFYSQVPAPINFKVGQILQGAPFVPGIHASGSIEFLGLSTSTDNVIFDIDGIQYTVTGMKGDVAGAAAVATYDLTGTVAAGDGDIGLTIDGVPYVYTPVAADDATVAGLAIETLINAGATHTATSVAGVITITSTTLGSAGNVVIFTDFSTDSGTVAVVTPPAGGVDAIAGTTPAEIASLLSIEINQGTTHTAVPSAGLVTIQDVNPGIAGDTVIYTLTQKPIGITSIVLQPTGGTEDQDATAGENLSDALDDMYALDASFYCVIVSQGINDDVEADNVATWVGANDRMFIAQTDDPACELVTDITSIMYRFQQSGYGTSAVIYSNDPDKYICASAFAMLATTSFRGTNTVKTLKFKDMPGVKVENLSPNALQVILDKRGNTFYETAGIRMLDSGQTSGNGWLDEIHGAAALSETIKVAVFSLLARTSTKIPYTEPGMSQIEAQVEQALAQFVTNGYLTSRVDTNGDILPAYEIWHTPVIDAPTNDKANRIAPDVQFQARLAGSVHAVTINGT
ncbi:MAG: hypothetical protein DRQ44_16940, partial [Gammaproteobacteria bacterium]